MFLLNKIKKIIFDNKDKIFDKTAYRKDDLVKRIAKSNK